MNYDNLSKQQKKIMIDELFVREEPSIKKIFDFIDCMKNEPIRYNLTSRGLIGHEKHGEFIEYNEFINILKRIKEQVSHLKKQVVKR